jgi:hypothetical protein
VPKLLRHGEVVERMNYKHACLKMEALAARERSVGSEDRAPPRRNTSPLHVRVRLGAL